MSFQATNHVVGIDTERPTDKLVLLLLANRHNPDEGAARPSNARIAAEGCMGERTVRDAMRRLEGSHETGHGPLFVEQRRGRPSIYRFRGLDPIPECPECVQEHPGGSRPPTPAAAAPPPRQLPPLTPAAPAPEPLGTIRTTITTTGSAVAEPPGTEILNEREALNLIAAEVTKDYAEEHTRRFGANPSDGAIMASSAKRAIKAGWRLDAIRQAAQACAGDRFGSRALEKHLRAIAGADERDSGGLDLASMLAAARRPRRETR